MIRLILVCVAIFGLSGCVSKPVAYPGQSEISLIFPNYQEQSANPFPISLGVKMPQGISVESDKLFYVTQDGARKPYAYHRWQGGLGRQLHERLVLGIAQKKLFKDVAKQNETIRADWILETEVLDFTQWMQTADSANVRFMARMRLVDASNREGISQKLVNFEIPMEELGVGAVTKAYNEALQKWIDETMIWITNIGEEKYAL